jgi:hypothetical protein
MIEFLWVTAEALSCQVAPARQHCPKGHGGMILCNLNHLDGFDAGNPSGG